MSWVLILKNRIDRHVAFKKLGLLLLQILRQQVEQSNILLFVLLLLGELKLKLGLLLLHLHKKHLLLLGLLHAVGVDFARRRHCLQAVKSLHNLDLGRRAVGAEFR